ncbi:unnamed protein product [Onchocerca flexuosa]|uniref:Uncharacterized protein n=1 Tax=Onchocerca flexuosa TaxID=387005 RepID=A0A183H1T8_9BILA|nr:unnamed protein product [Onchocerca flexuosa]
MPESEYKAFLKYDAKRRKYEYMLEFEESKKHDEKHIAKTLAVFGTITEGLQLFASFAILLNFQRFGKMKGQKKIQAGTKQLKLVEQKMPCHNFRVDLLNDIE